MRFPVFCLLAVQAFLVLGDVKLQTSIQDVFKYGKDQVPGLIEFRFEDDQFSEANGQPVDVTNPVYIRITLDNNAVLSRTIVDPTGTFTVAGNGAAADVPIDIMLASLNPDLYRVGGNLPEYAVQLVRGVEGESSIWLRITVPTSHWVDTDGDGLGDSPPTSDMPLSINIALDSGLHNNRMGESGFDFSTIANADTYANFGFDTPLSDTRFFIDFNPQDCGLLGGQTLQQIDVLAFASMLAPGAVGSPENSPVTKLEPPACKSLGVDSNDYAFLPINFYGDFEIARLLEESIVDSELIAPDVVKVGQSFELVNRVLGDNISLRVSWNFGVEKLVTNDTRVTYAFDKEGQYTVVSTAVNGNGASAESTALIMVTSLDATPDIVQLQAQALTSDQVLLTWQAGSLQDADLEGFQIYGRTDETLEYTILGQSSQTRFTAANLQMGREYTFLVEPLYSGNVKGLRARADIALPTTNASLPFRYRIPHLANSPGGWDSVVALNKWDEPVEVLLTAYTANGNVQATSSTLTELGAGEKSMGMLYHYFSQEDLQQSAWIELASNRELQCFQLFGEQTRMAGLGVDQEPLFSGAFLTARAGLDGDVQIDLINTSDTEADVKFTAWWNSSSREVSRLIPPKGKLQISARDLFGTQYSSLFQWYTWSSNQPLTSFQTWGREDQQSNATASLSGGQVLNIVPRINPQSQITMANMSLVLNNATIEAFDNGGRLVSSKPITLQPQARISPDLSVLAGSNFTGYLVVKSTAPLNCQVEFTRYHQKGQNMTEAISSISETGNRFFFPHIPNPVYWTTELLVINHSEANETVVFTAYNAEGQSLDIKSLVLPPHGRMNQRPQSLFGELEGIAYIRAISQRSVLAAHLLFYTNLEQNPMMGEVSMKPF